MSAEEDAKFVPDNEANEAAVDDNAAAKEDDAVAKSEETGTISQGKSSHLPFHTCSLFSLPTLSR